MISFGNSWFLIGEEEGALTSLESRLKSRYIPVSKAGAYVSALAVAVSAIFITTMPWLAITGMALGTLSSVGFHEVYVIARNYQKLIGKDLEKEPDADAFEENQKHLLANPEQLKALLQMDTQGLLESAANPNLRKRNFCLDRYVGANERTRAAKALTDKLLENTWILSRFCSDWIKSHIHLSNR